MALTFSDKLQLFPLLRVAFFLILGIIAGEQIGDYCNSSGSGFLSFCGSIWLWVSLSLVVFAAALFTSKSRYKYVQSILIFLLVTLLGIVLALHQQKNEAECQLPLGMTAYKAVLISELREAGNTGRTVSCDLLMAEGKMTGQKVKGYFVGNLSDQRLQRLHVGDGVLATSEMRSLRNDTTKYSGYANYLNLHGFSAITFIRRGCWMKAKVSLTGLTIFQRAQIGAMKWRKNLIDAYRQEGISEKELAVTAALTLGDKSMLSKELREDYSASGGAHVLAMSGLHLSVIYVLLTFLLQGGRNRFWAQLAAMITVWGFVFLAGMSPSLLRSALMLTVYAFATLLGRSKTSLNALALAAIVILVANPKSIHDVSFQLSFMAVFFLLSILPTVYGWVDSDFLMRHKVVKWGWGMIAVSIVSQLGVFPLVLYYFGRFPCYFIITNFIVIPSATLILYGALAFFLLVPFRPFIAPVLSWAASFMNDSLSTVASLPGASISGIHVNGLQTALLYLLIFTIIILIIRLSGIGKA